MAKSKLDKLSNRKPKVESEKVSDPYETQPHKGVTVVGGGDPRAAGAAEKGVRIVRRPN